jgi:tetratricopeptide (TPR) repeat protein
MLLATTTVISTTAINNVAHAKGAGHGAEQESAEQESAQQKKSSYRATKKVPAMRDRVYAQLARAQALADDGDKIEGFEVLDQVKDRLDSLNSYERAMLFNFYGFMYYANDDVEMAVDSFKQVVAEKAIPDSLILSTLYSLAQLSMQQQAFSLALTYLSRWQELNPNKLSANQEVFFAQIYYQDKQFTQSLKHLNNAITLETKKNKTPKENWLILQRANYYELKQPEQVTQVLEQLVRLFDKPKYWLQLSGMYGEIGEENKQIAVMEAAYQAGYVTKAADITTLAQLYLFHGAPYKSANMLAEAIDKGLVVADETNLDLLSRSYLAAKEDQLAIKVLMQLSIMVDEGKYDALLAQTYLNNEQWQLAITSAEQAITKSQFKGSAFKQDNTEKTPNYLGNMYLVQGMAEFNLQKFESSITAFKEALQISSSKKTAEQWAKYVEREKNNHQIRLAMLN